MDIALYLSFVGFSLAAAFTPGPNNLMLMSSGALFGFRKTLPHITGVAVGFNILMLCALLGMGVVIEQFPWILTIVKTIGAIWLAWMGVKFFIAAYKKPKLNTSDTKPKAQSRPFKFYEAVLFQWVNPKSVIMALLAASAYSILSDNLYVRILLICGTFLATGFASAGTWAIAGNALNALMSKGRSAIILNIIMGLLLFATALMIVTAKTHI